MTTCRYGYRIVGTTREHRRLVLAADAFSAYATCDELAEVHQEAYLSAFNFGEDFRVRADRRGNVDTKGYIGICGASWLWWDIDRPDALERALTDTRRLTGHLLERFRTLEEDDLLIFYSGSKGFHVGLPTCIWSPEPSPVFNRVARCFAETIAESARVEIDKSIYDKVRAFRAPNSRHLKTGRHKRRLSMKELLGLSLERILQLARSPEPFDIPEPSLRSDQAAAAWAAAQAIDLPHPEAKASLRAANDGTPWLNRGTLAFIRDGAPEGERAKRLFSAAANLAEFACPPELAQALLTEAALDSGLSPSEVKRQIDCGLNHVQGIAHDRPEN